MIIDHFFPLPGTTDKGEADKEDEVKKELESSKDDKSNEDNDSMGSSTIKTAQTMQESNNLRKIMYASAKRTAILDVFIIVMCTIDSEVRWKNREEFDEYEFD